MRTSLDIPDSLFQRAKKLARDRKTSLRALLLEGLRGILQLERPGAPGCRRRVPPARAHGGLCRAPDRVDSDERDRQHRVQGDDEQRDQTDHAG